MLYVAAAAFEDNRVGTQQAAPLGVQQHAFGEAVFHAAAGIEEFALGVDREAFGLEAQGQHRRVADEGQHGRRAHAVG